jgi:hypothetical protein
LLSLPVRQTYFIDEQNNLFIPGKLTPVDKMKEMEWQSLSSFI